jgi:hypothetical protein
MAIKAYQAPTKISRNLSLIHRFERSFVMSGLFYFSKRKAVLARLTTRLLYSQNNQCIRREYSLLIP